MQIDISKIKVIPNEANEWYELFYEDFLIKVPESIAIILDGNGRYAKKNNLPRALGHKAGCEALEVILEETVRLKIRWLTVYAFSTENWKRSSEEINSLFDLFFLYLGKIEEKALANNVKSISLGILTSFLKNFQENVIDLWT